MWVVSGIEVGSIPMLSYRYVLANMKLNANFWPQVT
jgi:hypothetical protein